MNEKRLDLVKHALVTVSLAEVKYFCGLSEVKEAHTSKYLNFIQELKTSGVPRKVLIKGKVVALIAVAVLVFAFLTACAFFSPIREFFVEIFDGHLELTPSNQDTTVIEEIRVPEYIPEGYTLTHHIADISVVVHKWGMGDRYIRIEQNAFFTGGFDLDI